MAAPAAGQDGGRADRTQRILLAMTSIGREITEAIAEELGGDDLATNSPILVLTELWRNGPQRPRRLQELARLTSGGMTKQLDHLERLGMIERSFGRVARDRRAIVVSLTPAGRRTATQIADALEAHMDQLRRFVRELDGLLAG